MNLIDRLHVAILACLLHKRVHFYKGGYFKKNVTIYCNIERRYVKLVIQGKVNNQSK